MKLAKTNGNKFDKRLGIERRNFSFILHIPERRSGVDRSSGVDRRTDLQEQPPNHLKLHC
jgi:hypothetical protein